VSLDKYPTMGSLDRVRRKLYGIFWNDWFYISRWVSDPADWTGEVDGTGYIDFSFDRTRLGTGTTVGSRAQIRWRIEIVSLLKALTWDRGVMFRTRVRFETVGDEEAWIVAGTWYISPHVGFKLVGDTLYATVADGTAESTLPIKTVSAGEEVELEAELIPGVEARFWINGAYAGRINTNLPSGSLPGVIFDARITNDVAIDKTFVLVDFEIGIGR